MHESPESSFCEISGGGSGDGDASDGGPGRAPTIARARRASGHGPDVSLLYSKSKVYVHPSSSTKDNICGYISLLEQSPAATVTTTTSPQPQSPSQGQPAGRPRHLLAWVPESSLGDARDIYVKVDMAQALSQGQGQGHGAGAGAGLRQSYLVPSLPTTSPSSTAIGLYAFAVPLSDIFSLLVRPPSLGWWFGSLVINTRAGDSYPALFFHDSECESTIMQKRRRTRDTFDPFSEDGSSLFWGGDEVLAWVRQFADVHRSSVDPAVYLVNPSEEDVISFCNPAATGRLERGLRPRVDPSSPSSAAAAAAAAAAAERRRKGKQGTGADAAMDPLTKMFKETRWKILERLSKITTFTRRTAADLADNPNVPPQVRRLLKNPEIQTLQDEFDSARLYLARWAMGIAEQSERERNQRIWTAKDLLKHEESAVGDFEILDMERLALHEKRRLVSLDEWRSWFDAKGRLVVTVTEVKERVFHGGLNPEDGVRKEAWLFLLGVFPWDSTTDERKAIDSSLRDEYVRLKGMWWDRLLEESATKDELDWFQDERHRIEKDVHRTDRTVPLFAGEDIPHPDPDSAFADQGTNVHLEQMKDMLLTYDEYNHDLGYVQGMSDLLAPIYAVTQDGSIAFWAFVGFMRRMQGNFLRDQSGMRDQLLTLNQLVQLLDPELYLHLEKADSSNFFFFFRPLLVWFKREFDWPDVLRLWETLWTDYLSGSFHIFVAMAILEKHRDVILHHLKAFDEVLKYFNDLSGSIDLVSTLTRAEALFYRFQKSVDKVDRRSRAEFLFPEPPSPVRHRHRKPEHQGDGDNIATATAAATTSAPSASAGDAGSSTALAAGVAGVTRTEVITPELRALLRKEPKKYGEETVQGSAQPRLRGQKGRQQQQQGKGSSTQQQGEE
ncbi:GTPase activating protein [Ascosphaera acerosa]|nr:GTPase activating protein [Ascosphaera acerosa]